MTDSNPDNGIIENSSVNPGSVTLNEQEYSPSSDSATGKAIDLLKKLRSQGEDYITKSLPKDKARKLAGTIGCKHGVLYNARAKILRDETKQTFENANENIDAKVDVDELLKDAKPVQPSADSKEESPSLPDAQPEQKKEFEPVPIESIQTISDVFVDTIADFYTSRGKPIPSARIKAVKETYSTTLKAYNASIPKWALIPICIALTLLVFVLPMKDDIGAGIKGLFGNSEQTEAMQ
jgi:hypothetical protein